MHLLFFFIVVFFELFYPGRDVLVNILVKAEQLSWEVITIVY